MKRLDRWLYPNKALMMQLLCSEEIVHTILTLNPFCNYLSAEYFLHLFIYFCCWWWWWWWGPPFLRWVQIAFTRKRDSQEIDAACNPALLFVIQSHWYLLHCLRFSLLQPYQSWIKFLLMPAQQFLLLLRHIKSTQMPWMVMQSQETLRICQRGWCWLRSFTGRGHLGHFVVSI